jgi:uroporphyrinogen decarboxylase
MTHRERVLCALNHREPDQVPVDLSGHRSSGIAAVLYPKLRRALHLPERPVYVYDPIQQLAIVDQDVLDRFGVDTIEMGRAFASEQKWWVDWTLPDGAPCKMPSWAAPEKAAGGWILRTPSGRALGRMPDSAMHFDQIYWPYADDPEDLTRISDAGAESMWSVFASPPGPCAATPAELSLGARRLRERTNRAVLGLFGGNLLETGQMYYRMDNFLTMLAGEPQRAHAFLDALVESHLEKLNWWLPAVGPYIDIIVFGDDLGAQNCPQISPRMYREFFKPRHQLLWNHAKKLAPVKVMLHCCGAVRQLLPDLIEAGLDAINPVQVSCRGMGAAGLKTDFGSELTFWGGGCDTQQMLPEATPDQVRAHVLGQLEILSKGGGFVFQQVHNILGNVPVENVIAMYGAVREFNQRTS